MKEKGGFILILGYGVSFGFVLYMLVYVVMKG